MSDTPEKKHSWAKFKARPVAPRPLTERPATGALAPKPGSAPAGAGAPATAAPVLPPEGKPLKVSEGVATGEAVTASAPMISLKPGGAVAAATPPVAGQRVAPIVSLAPGAPPVSPPVARAPVQSALAPASQPVETPGATAGKALARDFTGRGQREKQAKGPAGASAAGPVSAGDAAAAPASSGAKSGAPRSTPASSGAAAGGATGKPASAASAKTAGAATKAPGATPAAPAGRATQGRGSEISDTGRAPEARQPGAADKGRGALTPVAPAGPAAAPAPEAGAERETAAASAPITAELADTLSQLDDFQTAPGWPGASKRRVRPPGQGRLTWVALAARDSVRNYRETGRRLSAWWAGWRRSASCKVLLSFIALYGLLALMRAPSDMAVAQSRHAEEVAYLSKFLLEYTKSGGLVLAEKPHGGTELYPRGVVIKGDLLTAFARTPVGETFSYTPTAPEMNPLNGFYIFPSIYAGGQYFALERKFNFALYRCTYLIRKDSEVVGTVLMAKVE